jgi:hypothetical protein
MCDSLVLTHTGIKLFLDGVHMKTILYTDMPDSIFLELDLVKKVTVQLGGRKDECDFASIALILSYFKKKRLKEFRINT